MSAPTSARRVVSFDESQAMPESGFTVARRSLHHLSKLRSSAPFTGKLVGLAKHDVAPIIDKTRERRRSTSTFRRSSSSRRRHPRRPDEREQHHGRHRHDQQRDGNYQQRRTWHRPCEGDQRLHEGTSEHP